MLECVINISEGVRRDLIASVVAAGGDHVLDVHSDAHHNRSVATLAGPDVEARAFAVVAAAARAIDLRGHVGVHPRLGAADVVPFVPLEPSTMHDAIAARDGVARRIASELAIPCFLYGPERSLPQVRQQAFSSLAPDIGPDAPHPTAGACCLGARNVLVAYNVWLDPRASMELARDIASTLRGPSVRTLALAIDGVAQVSCNLLEPDRVGPAMVFDAVVQRAPVLRAELVGLLPRRVLASIPRERWSALDVDESKTIEARLEKAGLDGGSPRVP